MRALIIIALLAAGVVHAQQTWNYTDGNSTFNGEIVLDATLPANGTTTLTAANTQSIVFNSAGPAGESLYSVAFGSGTGWVSGNGLSYTTEVLQLTTTNGAITGWDINLSGTEEGTNSPATQSLVLTFDGASFQGQYCAVGIGCTTQSAVGTAGGWVDPKAAPELDLARAIAALTLLAGAVLILKSRRRTA